MPPSRYDTTPPMWCRRPATRNVTEPASSTRSQLDAVVGVGAGAGVCFGSGLVDRGEGGAVSGGGGGALDSTGLNDAVATQDTITQLAELLASASRPLPAPGSSAHTSRTALLTKRRAVRSTNHLVTKRA